jgi:hypothetical protein
MKIFSTKFISSFSITFLIYKIMPEEEEEEDEYITRDYGPVADQHKCLCRTATLIPKT